MLSFTWHFGERFLWIRKTTKLTQEGFGQLMGVSRQTVNAYENDRQRPTWDMMERVCRELEISPPWLLTGIGDPKNESSLIAAGLSSPIPSVSEQRLTPEQLSMINFVAENPSRAVNLTRVLLDEGLKNLSSGGDSGELAKVKRLPTPD